MAASRGRRRAVWVDVLFVAALVAASAALWARDDPVTKDTKFYLGEALDIARRGGVGDLLERCIRPLTARDLPDEAVRYAGGVRGLLVLTGPR